MQASTYVAKFAKLQQMQGLTLHWRSALTPPWVKTAAFSFLVQCNTLLRRRNTKHLLSNMLFSTLIKC
jgi:hypothetical protein